jgi:hypothetical protein
MRSLSRVNKRVPATDAEMKGALLRERQKLPSEPHMDPRHLAELTAKSFPCPVYRLRQYMLRMDEAERRELGISEQKRKPRT